MVGNACASAHRNVPPRDAARRTTSLRNARAAGDIPAALARLARTVGLKRSTPCGFETVWRLRATPYRGPPTRLNSLCARMTIMSKARVQVTIIQYACNSLRMTASGHLWDMPRCGKAEVIGRPPITIELERKAQRALRKGTGILKVAKLVGLGTGTVHRIKREMTAE